MNLTKPMRRIFLLIILLGIISSGCIPQNTGIQGQVLIGPMCPVAQQDNPCPDRPYPATLTILTMERKKVKSFTADGDGLFQVKLAPGNYILRPDPPLSIPFPIAPEQTFTVVAGQFTQLKITYDTGIR
jgi:hypothetical protein